jgi:nucleotidyltransferase substrate binding protein (TIGR01987 family)
MDERAAERLTDARRALDRLQEALALPAGDAITRDAAITRFTFTLEIVWRAARAVLLDRFGSERLQLGGPKAIVRECRAAGLLSDGQTSEALRMIDDRNLITHTYKEPVAIALYARLPDHAALLEAWYAAVKAADDGSHP